MNYTRLGVAQSEEGRNQYGWAAALSHPVTEKLAWLAELSGTARRGTGPASQILVGLTYEVFPRLVVDAGTARGISASATDRSIFVGFTLLLE